MPEGFVSNIRRLFSPPVFEDRNKLDMARILYGIGLSAALVLSLMLPVLVLAFPENLLRSVLYVLFIDLTIIIAVLITRRGYVFQAALFQVSSLWIILTVLAVTGGGLEAPAIAAQFVVVMVAGVLLGWLAAIIAGVVAALTVVTIGIAQQADLLPQTVVFTTTTRTVSLVSYLILLVALQVVILRRLQKARTALRRAYDIERYISQTLQKNLIPSVAEVTGLDIGIAYESSFQAGRVGGDLYDIFTTDEEQVVILIGDVSGKGVDSAVMTNTVRSTVRALSQEISSPADILTRANELIMEQTLADDFITAALIFVVLSSGQMKVASAGHLPPVIFSEDRVPSMVSVPPGLPLGIFPQEYQEFKGILQCGEIMVLYTDGVTEARRGEELFGCDRVMSVISSMPAAEPQAIATTLLEEVKNFAHEELSDDVAIVAVRRKHAS